jgi:hypothetical protein
MVASRIPKKHIIKEIKVGKNNCTVLIVVNRDLNKEMIGVSIAPG